MNPESFLTLATLSVCFLSEKRLNLTIHLLNERRDVTMHNSVVDEHHPPPLLLGEDGKNQVFQVCWAFTEVTVDRRNTDVLTRAANMGGSLQMNL